MTTTEPRQRIVIDSNVLVSAALFNQSTSGRAVELAFAQATVLIADSVIVELSRVLGRRKFERHILPAHRRSFLARLTLLSTSIAVQSDLRVCRDPKDNHILNLAVDGRASLILTGDQDLSVLHPFRGIEILSPATYLSRNNL